MTWPVAVVLVTAIFTVGWLTDSWISGRFYYRKGYTKGYCDGVEARDENE